MLSGPGPGGLGTGWSWPQHPEWRHGRDLGELSSWGLIETSLWLHEPRGTEAQLGVRDGRTPILCTETHTGVQREAPGTMVLLEAGRILKAARLIASANGGTEKGRI